MSQLRALIGTSLLAAGITACAVHEPVQAFRSSVFIGDRGISVPLPPPSFFDAPTQDVEVSGEVLGSDDLAAGSEVHIVDSHGEAELAVALNEEDSTFEAELELDLSDNCLEVWLVNADGTEGARAFYSTTIVAADEIEVVEGC